MYITPATQNFEERAVNCGRYVERIVSADDQHFVIVHPKVLWTTLVQPGLMKRNVCALFTRSILR